ncbi:hypothetical protein GCM10008969_01340 [Pseudomonas veronii subsp. inensis]
MLKLFFSHGYQLIKRPELIKQAITDTEENLPLTPDERRTQRKPQRRFCTLKQLRVTNRPPEGFRVMSCEVQQQLDTGCIIEMQHPAEGQAGEIGPSYCIHIKPKRCRCQALRTINC